MALILHCDGCHAQDGSLDGNKQLPPQGAPVATNQAPPRIKVWRNVQVYGKTYDLCNRCVGKINAVLQLPSDAPLDGPKAPKLVTQDRLEGIDPEISGRC